MGRQNQFLAYQLKADTYDVINESRQRTMAKKAKLVVDLLTMTPNSFRESILEVGCGTGLFTEQLAERLPLASIIATDAFPAMLERAALRLDRFPNVQVQRYDAEAAGPAEHGINIICGCDIIHHLDNPVNAMRNWMNLVGPGGRLVFFETNAWNPYLYLRNFRKPEEARFKYSTRRNLSRWLPEAGWRAARVDYAPIYLPNGPAITWRTLDEVERFLHCVPVMRLVAGGLVISAQAR